MVALAMREDEASVESAIVAGTPQLAHVATAEGMVAIGHIAGVDVTPIRKDRIPGCTYTEPGIGSVGMTEAQARQAGPKDPVQTRRGGWRAEAWKRRSIHDPLQPRET